MQATFPGKQNLPPPRRTARSLVERLFAACIALSVLCSSHSSLPGANQSQRIVTPDDPISVAIASGLTQRNAGHFAAAIGEFQQGLRLARERHDAPRAARCLVLISASQVLSFEYRAALGSAQEALILAREAKDYELAGAASGNMAAVYAQVGDFPAAERQVTQALDLLRQDPRQDAVTQGLTAKALLTQASLCIIQGRTNEGARWSQQGIALANKLGDSRLEALGLEASGTALLRENQISEAQKAFEKEYRLRSTLHDTDGLAVTKEHLAELELAKANPDYTKALRLIDEAFAVPSPTFKANAQYYPIHIRAVILLKSGRTSEALAEFRRAVRSADEWRRGALPGDITSSQTVAALNSVYRDFAELAAELSLHEHNPGLAREGLEVLAENRAASLREQLAMAFDRNERLPDSYFKELAELQAAQAKVTLGSGNPADLDKLRRIRLELDDLENQIGLQVEENNIIGERNSGRNSLRDIQARLSATEVLLSFCMDKEKSFLWAVSGDRMNLYQLSGEDVIRSKALMFTDAVRNSGAGGAPAAGQELSDALFGQLAARYRDRPEWLIVADGPLLNGVPFSDLPSADRSGTPIIAKHALRILPGELLLMGRQRRQPESRFVGIADPIYNAADSRLRGEQSLSESRADGASISLARLVGSDREIRSAAKLSGLQKQQLLTGVKATGTEVEKGLADNPEIVHFAVHVVSPPEQPQEAALALSLKQGIPELLTPELIATLRVPGSLVVLSGCSSEQGRALPGAGLMGLSRAWLLAGAAAVVVSAWPTPDDSGRFFSAFYSRLQNTSSGGLAKKAAIALQQAQLDMQASSGYSKAPSFWAAYSIVTKE